MGDYAGTECSCTSEGWNRFIVDGEESTSLTGRREGIDQPSYTHSRSVCTAVSCLSLHAVTSPSKYRSKGGPRLNAILITIFTWKRFLFLSASYACSS